jgi:hypothetical protein
MEEYYNRNMKSRLASGDFRVPDYLSSFTYKPDHNIKSKVDAVL